MIILSNFKDWLRVNKIKEINSLGKTNLYLYDNKNSFRII